MALAFVVLMLVLFGVSVFVHELGHFLAAKAFGMEATVFSIGMGKAIWSRTIGRTRWQIGWLPLGGYVALPQLDPNSFLEGSAYQDRDEPLEDVAPWKKVVVAVAGAAGNMVFALLLGVVVWIGGRPASMDELNGVVGAVAKESAAEEAGILVGDVIESVNGKPVANWVEIVTEVALSSGEPATLGLARGDERFEAKLPLEQSSWGTWMLPGVAGMDMCHVASVIGGSSAEAAGLAPGDQIVAYGGQKVFSRAHLSSLVEANGTAQAEIEVLRSGETVRATVAAAYDEDSNRHLIGVVFNTVGDLDYAVRSHPTPWKQIGSHVTSIVQFLRALVTPKTAGSAAGAVGGPVSIFVMLYLMVKASFMLALWFTGFLNVNLAIINLLPLPVLDGGHVVLNLWAWVTRRPVSARVVNVLANVFALLLIALFIFLSFRDCRRQLWPMVKGAWTSAPAEVVDEDAEEPATEEAPAASVSDEATAP